MHGQPVSSFLITGVTQAVLESTAVRSRGTDTLRYRKCLCQSIPSVLALQSIVLYYNLAFFQHFVYWSTHIFLNLGNCALVPFQTTGTHRL